MSPIASLVNEAKKQLPNVPEIELEAELKKYLDFQVPAPQALQSVLRHHGAQSSAKGGPAAQSVNVTVRLSGIRTPSVNVRGEAKTIVKGQADDGKQVRNFTSWIPLPDIKDGDTVEVSNAQLKEFQGNQELNFGDKTKVTKSTAAVQAAPLAVRKLNEVKAGESGIRLIARLATLEPRSYQKDGQARQFWSGAVEDETGRLSFTAWNPLDVKAGDVVQIDKPTLNMYRDAVQVVVDVGATVSKSSASVGTYAASAITIGELAARKALDGAIVVATVVEVKDGAGLILRCTTCNKALSQGSCTQHGRQSGKPDLRIRATLDDGTGTVVLNMGLAPTEAILGKTLEQCGEEARAAFRVEVIRDQLKAKLEGRTLRITGNAFTDEFGLTLLGQSAVLESTDPKAQAQHVLSGIEALNPDLVPVAFVAPLAAPVDANARQAFHREVAHRILAPELQSSTVEIKGQGEKDPSFVLTPFGLKVNRVHLVGTLTEVEPVGESGDRWRAKVIDPSGGVVFAYAGQYEPEAALALSEIKDLPCYVAITGKVRVYEPEPGKKFISLKPETIHVVDEAERNRNAVLAAQSVLNRLQRATASTEQAREAYGKLDLAPLRGHAVTVLKAIIEGAPAIVPAAPKAASAAPAATASAPTATKPASPPTATSAATDELDGKVFEVIQKLEGVKGARWDDVLTAMKPAEADLIEESMNRLMDKGQVYEPTLGVLKSTK
jgi:replication factor A1